MPRRIFKQNMPDMFYSPRGAIFSHNNTTLEFTGNGNIIVNGNFKDAARALFYYVLDLKSNHNYLVCEEFGRNVRIYFGDDSKFSIEYDPFIGQSIPNSFIELQKEFDKLNRLLVFI